MINITDLETCVSKSSPNWVGGKNIAREQLHTKCEVHVLSGHSYERVRVHEQSARFPSIGRYDKLSSIKMDAASALASKSIS